MKHKEASFPKGERLCGIKSVSGLFSAGRVLNIAPVRVVYRIMPADNLLSPVRVLISVPKRHFRKAVDRNLLRRRMREAWRKNRIPLRSHLAEKNSRIDLALIWNDPRMSQYNEIEKCIREIITRLINLKY